MIGEELATRRHAEVDDFTQHRRDAVGRDPHHELAALFPDGGRVQIRDETWGVEAAPLRANRILADGFYARAPLASNPNAWSRRNERDRTI